ncbi:MAG: ECF transporter S component [Oscillospiraceae bacterium]|nr:ECF transporter S component [Oscillospiraceae bacterium]
MENNITKKRKINTRAIAATAMLSALAYALMFIEISVPIMPFFIKFDISDLPALIASFAYGPVSGIVVCLVKNVINIFVKSQTFGIGELSNFLLGVLFVVPAGIIYKRKKTRGGAVLGAAVGAILSAVICFFSNYYIVYPLYAKLLMPNEVILSAYQAILPSVKNLREAIFIFNVPFTFCKFAIDAIFTFLIYKRISPILKGKM